MNKHFSLCLIYYMSVNKVMECPEKQYWKKSNLELSVLKQLLLMSAGWFRPFFHFMYVPFSINIIIFKRIYSFHSVWCKHHFLPKNKNFNRPCFTYLLSMFTKLTQTG